MWWLSFKGDATVIVRADTLVHARLLAAADEMARAYLFDAGFQVDPEFFTASPATAPCTMRIAIAIAATSRVRPFKCDVDAFRRQYPKRTSARVKNLYSLCFDRNTPAQGAWYRF